MSKINEINNNTPQEDTPSDHEPENPTQEISVFEISDDDGVPIMDMDISNELLTEETETKSPKVDLFNGAYDSISDSDTDTENIQFDDDLENISDTEIQPEFEDISSDPLTDESPKEERFIYFTENNVTKVVSKPIPTWSPPSKPPSLPSSPSSIPSTTPSGPSPPSTPPLPPLPSPLPSTPSTPSGPPSPSPAQQMSSGSLGIAPPTEENDNFTAPTCPVCQAFIIDEDPNLHLDYCLGLHIPNINFTVCTSPNKQMCSNSPNKQMCSNSPNKQMCSNSPNKQMCSDSSKVAQEHQNVNQIPSCPCCETLITDEDPNVHIDQCLGLYVPGINYPICPICNDFINEEINIHIDRIHSEEQINEINQNVASPSPSVTEIPHQKNHHPVIDLDSPIGSGVMFEQSNEQQPDDDQHSVDSLCRILNSEEDTQDDIKQEIIGNHTNHSLVNYPDSPDSPTLFQETYEDGQRMIPLIQEMSPNRSSANGNIHVTPDVQGSPRGEAVQESRGSGDVHHVIPAVRSSPEDEPVQLVVPTAQESSKDENVQHVIPAIQESPTKNDDQNRTIDKDVRRHLVKYIYGINPLPAAGNNSNSPPSDIPPLPSPPSAPPSSPELDLPSVPSSPEIITLDSSPIFNSPLKTSPLLLQPTSPLLLQTTSPLLLQPTSPLLLQPTSPLLQSASHPHHPQLTPKEKQNPKTPKNKHTPPELQGPTPPELRNMSTPTIPQAHNRFTVSPSPSPSQSPLPGQRRPSLHSVDTDTRRAHRHRISPSPSPSPPHGQRRPSLHDLLPNDQPHPSSQDNSQNDHSHQHDTPPPQGQSRPSLHASPSNNQDGITPQLDVLSTLALPNLSPSQLAQCGHETCRKREELYKIEINNLNEKITSFQKWRETVSKEKALTIKKEKENEKRNAKRNLFPNSPKNENKENKSNLYTPNSQSPLYKNKQRKRKTEKEVEKTKKRKRIHSQALAMTTEDEGYNCIQAIVDFCENEELPKPLSFHVQYIYGIHNNEKFVGIVSGKASINQDYDIHCILCNKLFQIRDPTNGDSSGVSPCRGVMAESVNGSIEVKYGAVCPSHTFDNDRTMGHYEKIEDIFYL